MQPKTDKYLVQTRSQTKSSSIKILEIHGANKGLDPHVQPGKQRPPPSLPTQSIDKGPPTHPISKPRIGQGRARQRTEVKTHQPISLPKQSPAQPITKHVQKTIMSLPESTAQSQIDAIHQLISIPLPQFQQVDPTSIIPQIGPKIQHRPSPQYHDPYTRPPPRPSDVTDPLDRRKDLLDNDLDRDVDIEENSP